MYVNLGEILDELASKIAAKIATPQTYIDLRTLDPMLKMHAYAAARTGALQAQKKGKRWYCTAQELARWMREDSDSGSGTPADADVIERWSR